MSNHKKWKSIYKELPKDKAVCVSRISNQEGFCGSSIYDTGTATFRTYLDKSNRLVITVWKHDEWYYAEDNK